MVFAKSYNAQLARSIEGARAPWSDSELTSRGCGACMISSGLIDGSLQRPKLPRMAFRRFWYSAATNLLVLAALMLLGACERQRSAARTDSMTRVATTATDAGTVRRGKNGWNIAAGP